MPLTAAAGEFTPPTALTIPMAPGTYNQLVQDEATEDAEDTTDVSTATATRGFMEVGFRGRTLSVPGSMLDIWYFNETDEGWAHSDPRPKVKAYSLGLEFVLKERPETGRAGSSNGIFYFDWLANLTDEGYWDDVEDPPDHLDGDYVVPSKNLGLLVLGADYAYEIHMVRTEQTNGNFGLSMLVGAGLGVGVLIGSLEYWDSANGIPAFDRVNDPDAAPSGDKRIPKVLPVIDVNVGLRFNFGDRFVLRVEGGLHDMLYMGGSLGVMF